jgi:hypothetical protein
MSSSLKLGPASLSLAFRMIRPTHPRRSRRRRMQRCRRSWLKQAGFRGLISSSILGRAWLVDYSGGRFFLQHFVRLSIFLLPSSLFCIVPSCRDVFEHVFTSFSTRSRVLSLRLDIHKFLSGSLSRLYGADPQDLAFRPSVRFPKIPQLIFQCAGRYDIYKSLIGKN